MIYASRVVPGRGGGVGFCFYAAAEAGFCPDPAQGSTLAKCKSVRNTIAVLHQGRHENLQHGMYINEMHPDRKWTFYYERGHTASWPCSGGFINTRL